MARPERAGAELLCAVRRLVLHAFELVLQRQGTFRLLAQGFRDLLAH